ncbi:MAG TPA: PD-(D/E)XK nuclease family protein [Blastococcus sp.]|jgi:putative RecB family exonuclease
MRNPADGAQPVLPGMPRRLLRASPKSLADFSDCPRRYRYANIDRPVPARGPRFAHHTVGTALHQALAGWWDLAVERRTAAAARQLLYAAWSLAGFRDAEQSERWRVKAAGWLTDYIADQDAVVEPRARERTVSTMTERMTLSGRVDRIDERDGELVVIDYKTGRMECTDDEARGSQALALYVLGVRRTLRQACSRVELHHLPTGTVASFEHTERSLANHVRRAEDIAVDITAATERMAGGAEPDAAFPAVPGKQCSWCDFRPSCPTGQAAVPARETWGFLPAEDENGT